MPSCATVNHTAKYTLKEDRFYHPKLSCDPRLTNRKHNILDYKKQKERLGTKKKVATKMLKSLNVFHYHQILFLGIFYLMCFGTNGADKDVSLLGKKLQMVDTEHPSPLMRSKRDSSIDREGMYLYLNIIIWSYQLTQNTIIGQIGSFCILCSHMKIIRFKSLAEKKFAFWMILQFVNK